MMPRPDIETGTPGPCDQPHVYAYGLVRLPFVGAADLPAGISGGAVRLIVEGDLGALISTVAAAFEVELQDADAAKGAVLSHHVVLLAASAHQNVLPLRFGTVFCDEAAIRAAMIAHAANVVEALHQLGGAREWGVKIFCDRAVLGGMLETRSPTLAALQNELLSAPQGRAFFLTRRIAQAREQEIDRALAQDLDYSRRSLCEVSRAEAAMRLRAGTNEMVWNGAYLVPAGAEARFFAGIEALKETFASRGYRCDVTGPWPPYNFADCSLKA
jgi:hypothetical protein